MGKGGVLDWGEYDTRKGRASKGQKGVGPRSQVYAARKGQAQRLRDGSRR